MSRPLHLVTDDAVLSDDAFADRARAVLEAGGARVALHLRGPGTAGRRLWELAAALRPVATRTEGLLFANDRVDVALAAGLDGVQLGERSLPVTEARGLLPEGRRVGASVHDVDGADRAAGGGADFVVLGTIFATSSHPGRPSAGPALITGVRRRAAIPVVAIGGITPERVDEVVRAGARGVAVLSGVWGAPDPVEALAGYLQALDDAGAQRDSHDEEGR